MVPLYVSYGTVRFEHWTLLPYCTVYPYRYGATVRYLIGYLLTNYSVLTNYCTVLLERASKHVTALLLQETYVSTITSGRFFRILLLLRSSLSATALVSSNSKIQILLVLTVGFYYY